MCVDSNGVINADAGCAPPGAAVVITNTNTNEVLTVTVGSDGSFHKVSQTAQPGHVLHATLANPTAGTDV